MIRWLTRVPAVLLAVCVCVLSCAEEEDGNTKPVGGGGTGIHTYPPGGGGDAGTTDTKTPTSTDIPTHTSGSDGTTATSGTTTSTGDTGSTSTESGTGICAGLSIPLECCQCLILADVCAAERTACTAEPDCSCVTLCWFAGQDSFDACADSCAAADNPLLVDLRVCIDANCPICLI